jgi:hypothetical protein
MIKPIAFLSYVREVDGMGDVTRFREALELAVRERGFESFEIFHDRLHIIWGEDWQQRVLASVDDLLLFVPIISPGFFTSEACRFELSAFIERETQGPGLGAAILPVYFVDTPAFNAHDFANDKVMQALARPTFLDFRECKLLPKDDIYYRREIDRAAVAISRLLSRNPTPSLGAQPAPANHLLQSPDITNRDKPPVRRWRVRLYKLVPAALLLACLAGFGLHEMWSRRPGVQPGTPPMPPLEPLQAECVIIETTQSFFGPSTNAPYGPTLAAKRRLQIVGRVADSQWVAARDTDQKLFFFPDTVCMVRLE